MRLKKTDRMITTVNWMLMKMIMRKIMMIVRKMTIIMWKTKLIICLLNY